MIRSLSAGKTRVGGFWLQPNYDKSHMTEQLAQNESVRNPYRTGCLIFGVLAAALGIVIIVVNPLGVDEDCCFPIDDMWNSDHPLRSAAFYDNAADALERYLLAHGWVKADDPKKRGLLRHFTIPMQKDRWYQK